MAETDDRDIIGKLLESMDVPTPWKFGKFFICILYIKYNVETKIIEVGLDVKYDGFDVLPEGSFPFHFYNPSPMVADRDEDGNYGPLHWDINKMLKIMVENTILSIKSSVDEL